MPGEIVVMHGIASRGTVTQAVGDVLEDRRNRVRVRIDRKPQPCRQPGPVTDRDLQVFDRADVEAVRQPVSHDLGKRKRGVGSHIGKP